MGKETKKLIVVFIVALAWILGMHYAFSAQESRVFNKLTGSDTTALDACFVQLRVIEPSRGE